jgi:hypothetical protein
VVQQNWLKRVIISDETLRRILSKKERQNLNPRKNTNDKNGHQIAFEVVEYVNFRD